MAEKVTRQFVDETTGDPITGGQFRLVSKTDPLYPNITLVEIPDQTPGIPDGRYSSVTTVQTGIYGIERFINGVWVQTSDEITVEPGRWMNSGGGEMIVADYLEAVIRAGGHFNPGSTPDLVALGSVLTYAHDNGFNTVVVGSFRGIKIWEGGSALVVPDGMFVDLAGATIQCSTQDVAAVLCSGSATIVNGTIACSGTSSSQHVTSVDPAKEILFVDVNFTGLSSTHATVTTSSGDIAKATFIGCSNVIVDNLDSSLSVAKQTVIGGKQNAQHVNGSPFVPPAHANATGTEIGDLVRFVLSSVAPAGSEIPPSSEPFVNMRQVAAAIRNLWFVQKPLIADSGSAVVLTYAKKDSDIDENDPVSRIQSISSYMSHGGFNASITSLSLHRKATVIERGKYRKAVISIGMGGFWSFTFTPTDPPPYQWSDVYGSVEINIADIVNDLKISFPGASVKGYVSRAVSVVEGIANVTGNAINAGGSYIQTSTDVDPTTLKLILPVYNLGFAAPNAKSYRLRTSFEVEVNLCDNSANGIFQSYGTIGDVYL